MTHYKPFQWAPTLGGECYWYSPTYDDPYRLLFQWAPTLGGECYQRREALEMLAQTEFQWAPTLGGECYQTSSRSETSVLNRWFQWAPTLGGECYEASKERILVHPVRSFNGHPPLGVNATIFRGRKK